MSKEERALEAYPVVMTILIPTDNEHPLIEQDCNQFKRAAYIEGYRQAEKDLELTWEDIEAIDDIFTDVFKDGFDVITNDYYKEVLNRFNKQKGKNI